MSNVWSWLQWILARPGHRLSNREVTLLGVEAVVLFLLVVLLPRSLVSYRLSAGAGLIVLLVSIFLVASGRLDRWLHSER